MGDNKKFDVSGIFWGVLLIVGGGELITIEDLLWSVHGYQLLAIATSYLVGNNREFDVSYIFWGGGKLMTIEDSSLGAHCYQMLSLATSQ